LTQIPYYEAAQAITLAGGEDLNHCMQCGLCSSVCPWREVDSDFLVRRMIRQGQLGVEGYESENILFGCTTCNKCVINCLREVDIIGIVRAMRSMMVEVGSLPETLKTVSGSCRSHGNPWSEPREKRMDWAKDLDIPEFEKGTEYFLFVCCTSCYDPRCQNIARSLVRLLKKAGVSFGVIGSEESCCGESLRKIGDEKGFQRLADSNISLFMEHGVKKIITTSPHCLYAFTREYPELGGDFEVIHSSQFLAGLLKDNKLAADKCLTGQIAFHDPCYLGRHMEVFQAPRDALSAIGSKLVKMNREERSSLCCGGGGGRLWLETSPEKRFSTLRVQEAVEAGAEILATCCPYCISLLEDSRKTAGLENRLEVLELSELLLRAIVL